MVRLALLVLLLLALPAVGKADTSCTPVVTPKTGASLAWVPPVATPGLTLTGYSLAQQIDAGTWTSLPDIAPTQTTTTVANLPPGHTYTWRLTAKARKADGTTGVSEAATYQPDGSQQPCMTVTVPQPTTLQVPTNFRAVPQ